MHCYIVAWLLPASMKISGETLTNEYLFFLTFSHPKSRPDFFSSGRVGPFSHAKAQQRHIATAFAEVEKTPQPHQLATFQPSHTGANLTSSISPI
jgi:hypothetical protein